MSTIKYVWSNRNWKLARILYRAYAWRINRTILLLLLLLLFLVENTDILRVPGWGGR